MDSSVKKIKSKENKIYKTTFDENEHSSMTDFQLAETNLMECLIRTNIINRILYVLYLL